MAGNHEGQLQRVERGFLHHQREQHRGDERRVDRARHRAFEALTVVAELACGEELDLELAGRLLLGGGGVSRIIEEIQINNDLEKSVHEAMVTSGKAVTFTAVTMIISTLFWVTSNIRFNAEMGLLLAIWMGISYVGSQTLLPVLILIFRPKFILKEAGHAENRTLVRI